MLLLYLTTSHSYKRGFILNKNNILNYNCVDILNRLLYRPSCCILSNFQAYLYASCIICVFLLHKLYSFMKETKNCCKLNVFLIYKSDFNFKLSETLSNVSIVLLFNGLFLESILLSFAFLCKKLLVLDFLYLHWVRARIRISVHSVRS